jgi:ABC-2 type transport system ATP-binding protein
VIAVSGLSKRYGHTLAVEDVTFEVLPGRVTGFLGPNGAGKSTTMRLILGLDAPDTGTATIGGRRYRSMRRPLQEVGSLLESAAMHPGRTAQGQLLALAAANRIDRRRVDEVLGLVGLDGVGGRRIGKFSLGMTQRLGVAAALLGDPGVLLLDEPVNGLDPEGVAWIRMLVRSLAAEGRTVFLSSHLMSEMEHTADHLIVIGRGRLLADQPLAALTTEATANRVHVRSAQQNHLAQLLRDAGATIGPGADGGLTVTGVTAHEVGVVAACHAIALQELFATRATLEEAFMRLTRDRDHDRTHWEEVSG